MANYQQILYELLKENKVKEHDIINLHFVYFKHKHNQEQEIYQDIVPTITTKSNLVVVVKGDEE